MPLDPQISCLIAPNPSPMTHRGTNTWVIGPAPYVVIDPGPAIDSHLDTILKATDSNIAAILVTHAHLDHSPMAGPLAQATGAKIYAFGDAFAGRSALMQQLADQGDVGGGEGVDAAFVPDICVEDGAILTFGDKSFNALWTPGHFGNHLCFAFNDVIFCGDHVMGWASSLVSPPDGDLGAFMRSCALLLDRSEHTYLAGHGDPIEDGPARVRWLIDHRKMRESQVLDTLAKTPDSPDGLAQRMYTDVNPALLPAAARNVLAHLIDLTERGLVKPVGNITQTTVFEVL